MNVFDLLLGARRRTRRSLGRLRRRLIARRTAAPAETAPSAPAAKPPAPQISVVMVIGPSASAAEECLDSVLEQAIKRIEVILVSAGAPEPTLDELADRDRRIRVVANPANADQTNPREDRWTVAEARKVGVAAARGKYLTFVDPGDTLPAQALSQQIASLRRSGSNFVTGAVHRVHNGNAIRPAWVNAVHGMDRSAITIAEFPEAIQSAMLENRVFVRDFYVKHVSPALMKGVSSDSLATAISTIRASSFDVLSRVTYRSHVRADRSSIVVERVDATALDARLDSLKSTWAAVEAETSPRVLASWLGGVIDSDLGLFLQHAAASDQVYRDRLKQACRLLLTAAGESTWPHVRVDRRLRLWLGAHDRWSELENLVEYVRLNGAIPPTLIDDGKVWADFPSSLALPRDIPHHLYELAESQTSLSGCVQRVSWDDDGVLHVDGWAFIRGVDLSVESIGQRFFLVDSSSGDKIDVPSVQVCDPTATRWANHLGQTIDRSGFRLAIDVDALPGPSPSEDGTIVSRRWVLHVEAESQGVWRRGTLRYVAKSAIGLRMRARDLSDPSVAVRIIPVLDSERGFTIQLRPDRVRAEGLRQLPGGTLTGSVRSLTPLDSALVAIHASSADVVRSAVLHPQEDGTSTFSLELPVGADPQAWAVRAVTEAGQRLRMSWPMESQAGTQIGGGAGEAAWRRSPRGFCDIDTDTRLCSATDVQVTNEAISVDVRGVGLEMADLRSATLRGAWGEVALLRSESLENGDHRLVFPTQTTVWGVPQISLATATYELVLTSNDLVCGVSQSLLERMPLTDRTDRHRVVVNRTVGHDQLRIRLSAPLAEDEVGRRAQRVLGDWYEQTEFTPRDGVLFQCYRGEFATDSQLAIHQELWRRGTHLTLWWAVFDYSVQLPEGAVALLIGSREWYEAVGSARYLCHNIDFDRFFRKREHQRYLQTFHGYPFKSMGISLWNAQGKSPAAIDSECDRRNAAWDSILVPAAFCEDIYRAEYRYEHEVLVTGYPRDDVLVTDAGAGLRASVLSRLRVGVDQKVVLYAPTWRDTGATGAFRAKLFDELDLDQLVEELGDGFTILVRGHNYNLREGESVSAAAVVDVTTYPEINDLIIAADVAVLDYSSLRFDWGITGKPVVFFVPDLDDYISARTALFDYGPTAPGPLLSTTEQVIESLRELENVADDYAAARQDFITRYHGLHDGRATQRVIDAFFRDETFPDHVPAKSC